MKDQESIHFLTIKKDLGLAAVGIRPFFTTRQGGESRQPYDTLNLGLHVADDPQQVIANRRRVQTTLSPSVTDLVLIHQVHGTTTLEAPEETKIVGEGDALVTRQKGVAIGVMTADCAPVLLADKEAGIVAAAHAGWRGAVGGVLESCLAEMVRLGADPKRMVALIGPCIRPPHYEVDALFRDRFMALECHKARPDCQNFFSFDKDNAIFQFRLADYIVERLTWNHLSADRIVDVGLCTYRHHHQFFSHRRSMHQGKNACGRQMGGIYLY